MDSGAVGGAYWVKTSFMAIRPGDERPRFMTIPANAIISIDAQPHHSDFVEIQFHGETVAAFAQDVDARCEPVQAQAKR